MKLRIGCLLLVLAFSLSTGVRVSGADSDESHRFRLHSATFENNTTLPLSTIFTSGSPNACTLNGEPGGNQSPELSWTGTPEDTRSFVVIMYDVTAAFTHWGMYNISGKRTGLPAGAGVAGSTFGEQIYNDYGIGEQYDGPCPPTTASPQTHEYVFTVYALDTVLPILSAHGDFGGPYPEALYNAVLAVTHDRHILASASITGFYSAIAPPGSPE